MKKIYLTLFICLATIGLTQAQWTTGNDIYSTNPGSVGIGTSTPISKLDVNGNGNFTGSLQIGNAKVNSNTTKLFLNNTWGDGKNWALSSGENGVTEQGFNIYNWTDSPNSPLLSINNTGSTVIRNSTGGTLTLEKRFTNIPALIFQGATAQTVIEAGDSYITTYINGNRLLTTLANGNTGIGTNNPTEKLSVNGKIRAQEIKVETANWPDYVFKPSYDLRPLAEIKAYIDANQHLPEVPSAQQIAKDGVSLGQINALLLKKVEELTLYLIEKDGQLDKQNEKLDKQQKQISEILSMLNQQKHK